MKDDLSSIFEKLNINKDAISPEMIDNLMNMINNSSTENTDNSSQNVDSSIPDIDLDTIMKIKSIIDQMNKKGNNPSLKLLNDLKPFVPSNKQNKIDEYIKMDKMLELLPLLGGDFNTRNYSDNKVLLFSLIALLF